MTTLKALANQYNELAARLGERPVNRFPDRKAAERRLAALKAKLPGSWAERTGYGMLKATEPKHALNMTPKQRKAFHGQVAATFAGGGTEAVMRRWPDVSKRILAGHIRIAKRPT